MTHVKHRRLETSLELLELTQFTTQYCRNANIQTQVDKMTNAEKSAENNSPTKPHNARRKLWDIPDCFLCSVIGTCLSLPELRKKANKTHTHANISDYNLHGLMVQECSERSTLSRSIHKMLDRKYTAFIKEGKHAKSEEAVRALWMDAVRQGKVPGAYWMLMTHPMTTQGLIQEAFGDVHMLSHLQGASRGSDLRRLESVEVIANEKSKKVSELKSALKRKNTALMLSQERVRKLTASLQQLRDQTITERAMAKKLRRLQQQHDELQTKLKDTQNHNELMQTLHTKELNQVNHSLGQMRAQRDLLIEETQAAEVQITILNSLIDRSNENCESCPARIFLNGKCILYVGGRSGLIRHYREIVERSGGRFLHHDGGVEEGIKRLEQMVRGATVVVCPMDAVSHDASLRVKKACKHNDRTFMPLRTSGVTSLAAALHTLAS